MSKIHLVAAPIPRTGSVWLDSVWRVPNPPTCESCSRADCDRSRAGSRAARDRGAALESVRQVRAAGIRRAGSRRGSARRSTGRRTTFQMGSIAMSRARSTWMTKQTFSLRWTRRFRKRQESRRAEALTVPQQGQASWRAPSVRASPSSRASRAKSIFFCPPTGPLDVRKKQDGECHSTHRNSGVVSDSDRLRCNFFLAGDHGTRRPRTL